MITLTKVLVLATFMATIASAAIAAENRCGWYQNPTPGNQELTDKDATWSISSQMQALGHDAQGIEKIPEFGKKQFVETNVPGTGYGYGCACMQVETDSKKMRIARIYSVKVLNLSVCKSDKALPPPE